MQDIEYCAVCIKCLRKTHISDEAIATQYQNIK